MKKVVSLFQNISGYIGLVAYALLFVYSLGMATPAAPLKQYQDTITYYSQIMPYNNAILLLSIFGLIICAFYYVLRNHQRQVYYVSNFAWYGVNCSYTILSAIISIIGIATYQTTFSQLDFATINNYFAERQITKTVNANTPVFLLGYLCVVLLVLTLIPYILVLIDKIQGRRRYENNKKNGVANPVTYNPKEAK